MTDYGATDTSTTTLGANQFPVSAVWVANDALRPVQGGTVTTDSGGKKSAPMAVYAPDGNDITQGAKGDAAQVDPTQSASVVALLKGLLTELVDIEAQTTTTPTVSGTVTANQGGSNWSMNVAQINAVTPLMGNGVTGTGSQRVTIASDNTAFTVNAAQSGAWNVTNVSGTISLPTGASTSAKQPALGTAGSASSDVITIQGIASMTAVKVDGSGVTQPVSGTFWQSTQPVSIASLPALPANQSVNNAQVAGNTLSVDAGTSGNGTQRVIQAGAATGTKSNVASSASSVTILASNTSRKGAMVYNDSTQILYLDLSGGTASSSSYSVQIPANGFFEVPGPTIYSGLITGIWAAANGNARITEFS